jgi:hypothetical protein
VDTNKRKTRARLRLRKDTLRVLSHDEMEAVRGGVPDWFRATHPNCPNDSRYCL